MERHLPGIDGLRAFAVLSVIAYHAGLPVPAGYVGVDVFFVISGFVISRMLLGEPRIDLLAFYARRVRRILPALLVVIATTLAFTGLLTADLQVSTTHSAFAALGMGANVYFQWGANYFDVGADQMPLLHLWSLGVEEQFYLLWPVLLIAFRRRPWVLAVLAVASLAFAQYWIGVDRQVAFYQMPARFWELALGGLVAIAPASRLGALTAVSGLLGLTFGVVHEAAYFPGLGVALPVLGTGLVLHAVHSGMRIAPFEWRPVRYVGLVSYSLYLWHWPLLALNRGLSLRPVQSWEGPALCVVAFGLAALSYHFVEQPSRRGTIRLRAVGVWFTACAVLAGCAAVAAEHAPRYVQASLATNDMLAGCFVDPFAPAILPDPVKCGDGDVVLWGDSHAFMWRPVAERFGQVYPMTRGACPPSLGDKGNPQCQAFAKLAVERAKRGHVVVLAARWSKQRSTEGFDAVLDALSGVPRVVVIGPLPEMPYRPEVCLGRERPSACQMSREEFERIAAPLRRNLEAAVNRHPNAEFIDPAGFFCLPTVCPLLKDGMPLFRDQDHISASAARAFARSQGTRQTAE